jgi:hypothetical protein
MIFNPLYLLATAALGWGFSLAIYRPVAMRYDWPMGIMQSRHPLWVSLLGTAALVLSFLYIISDPTQRWPILVLGLLFALFWTGFLRVASQTSLFLAPISALLLGVVWASTEDGLREIRDIDDKIIERSKRIEQRIEERLRGALQKRQQGAPGSVVEEIAPKYEPLAPTPTPPIIRQTLPRSTP